jgi:hypothetical protein
MSYSRFTTEEILDAADNLNHLMPDFVDKVHMLQTLSLEPYTSEEMTKVVSTAWEFLLNKGLHIKDESLRYYEMDKRQACMIPSEEMPPSMMVVVYMVCSLLNALEIMDDTTYNQQEWTQFYNEERGEVFYDWCNDFVHAADVPVFVQVLAAGVLNHWIPMEPESEDESDSDDDVEEVYWP